MNKKISMISCPNPKCNANMGKIFPHELGGIVIMLQVEDDPKDKDEAIFHCEKCHKSFRVNLTSSEITDKD
jgi:hypothetical protein